MKTIVITGAGGALGRLAVKTLADAGYNLALLGRAQDHLENLIGELDLPAAQIDVQVADLLDEQSLRDCAQAVLSKFGGAYALIHLVGGWVGGKTVAETPADDLEFMLNQHVRTTFNLFKAFEAPLAQSPSGRVILVSSPQSVAPTGKVSAYAAAKAAQENLAFTFAAELKESRLAANVIHVRSIDAQNKGAGTRLTEIVSAMQYLLSDAAGKISGQRIPLY
ncbi:MAG: SDR family NAD(P)-dependent oxidoreductase [Anaerolineales bacterium]|nr:SDR family NAD(P)-dependent oxidoreductase [Anaerolineales bacterium]